MKSVLTKILTLVLFAQMSLAALAEENTPSEFSYFQ